jgi:pilus assembly protein CpaE
MEAELGESWGDLTFGDAIVFLGQPDADTLQFVAIAVDSNDENDLTRISSIITTAKDRGIKVILIADEVSPIALHQLLKLGADGFVPYPLPANALHEAIERLKQAPVAPEYVDPAIHAPNFKVKGDRDGVILPVHALVGGAGATTFAVNLAWEIANVQKDNPPRVCILDFNFQFGSVSTYLDLPRREAVYEMLSDTASMDADAFLQSMLTFNEKLSVLTAPADMLPLDIVTSEDINRILDVARANFDFVIIDMPASIVQWTEAVLSHAHVYFALMELDMRSAQNALRMLRALKAEELPFEKLRFVLNRAPKFTDLSGKSRAKRLAESLDITLEAQLPDGGYQVTQSNDHGLPLSETAAKNPLRREIVKLAKQIYELNKAAEAARA